MPNHARTQQLYVKSKDLGTANQSFHFEVSPLKRCCGGPYMYTGDAELGKFCASMTGCQKQNNCCGKGFVGAPKRFEYTPESNSEWKNERCNP